MSELLMSDQNESILDVIMNEASDKDDSGNTETRVPVKCDKILKTRAEEFVKTDAAKQLRIYYLSDFISLCVKEGLEKYAKPIETPHRLFIPNTKDHLLDLDLDLYTNRIVCVKCDSEKCIHIEKIRKDKTVQKYIRDFLKSKQK